MTTSPTPKPQQPPARGPIDEALAHLAGGWPGVAFGAEHQRTWRVAILDAAQAGRIRPSAFLEAARRYVTRDVQRPRLGEFLREAEEAEATLRARDQRRAPPSRQIAPDETPADHEKVQAIFQRFRARRRAKRTDEEAAAERDRQRANNDRFRREAKGG